MKKGYIILVVLLLLIALVVNRYPVIFQEGNPLPVFFGIMAIELTGQDLVPFPDLKMIQKAADEEHLNDYLAERGWLFKDRLGLSIVYKRGSEQLNVNTRMFTSRYIIYEFDRPLR
ncbi:MAG: hypothetical protein ACNA7Z_03990 [Dethiobacteria bacterium]|nr:hypothetical protein [Bacillota bacterium]MDW7729808.1 hypothetical protein [Bacillota bacterium]